MNSVIKVHNKTSVNWLIWSLYKQSHLFTRSLFGIIDRQWYQGEGVATNLLKRQNTGIWGDGKSPSGLQRLAPVVLWRN